MRVIYVMLVLLMPVALVAGEVLVTWTPLDRADLDHTRIYYARCADGPPEYNEAMKQGVMPDVTQAVIPFPIGQWCFQVRHVLTDFSEVVVSDVCAGEIPKKAPLPPRDLVYRGGCKWHWYDTVTAMLK